MADERSPTGAPVYRHTRSAPSSGEIAHADDARIGDHLARVHDGAAMVWHELISDRVHIDVHCLAPTEAHPYHLLCTSGMSSKPMNVPAELEGREQWRFAELCMLLPPDWAPSREAFEDERVYWPIRLLKGLARLPHDFGSWLGWGHSIPNGDPAEPYAPDTQLSGAILIPPFLLGKDLFVVPGEPPMHVFQVLPVTAREMDFKLQQGVDPLLELLENAFGDALYGPVDPLRPSAL